MENLSSTVDLKVGNFLNGSKPESPDPYVSITVPEKSRRIHRVPQQLRALQKEKQRIYDPEVVSLGPYHHGGSGVSVAESYKDKILQIFISESNRDEVFLMDLILTRIDDIRNCYVDISTNIFDNAALAKIILRDACFIIYAMKDDEEKLTHHLGVSGVAYMAGDFFMLENQIPLWVIQLLINLIYDPVEGEQLLCSYLSYTCFGDNRLQSIPWENAEEEAPLHLLEAQRRILLQGDDKHCKPELKQPRHRAFRLRWLRWKRFYKDDDGSSSYKRLSLPFNSATDLKSKGIHFRPSSNCLKDIRFKSYSFYGRLKLPVWFVTNSSKVLFRNMIAYEMSPEADTAFEVTSYINFMKSLIESPKDVKQLRFNGVLFSNLGSDEEVVQVFREIDTHGLDNEDIFHDVKMRVEKYCASKVNRWLIELFYANFRTPWAVIAFLAAMFLLCLTFLQTYFTINPTSS